MGQKQRRVLLAGQSMVLGPFEVACPPDRPSAVFDVCMVDGRTPYFVQKGQRFYAVDPESKGLTEAGQSA